MVFKWHNKDYLRLPNEDEVAAALRKSDVPSGQYVIPYCMDMKALQTQDMQQKFVEGPVGYINLRPTGVPDMGKSLGRSEEHTSELQSLMRISYAVFCLKKKNKTRKPTNVNHKVTHYTQY